MAAMTEEGKKALHDVLFDPKAPVGIAYELADDHLTITVYQGDRVLACVTIPDMGTSAAVRGTAAMLFFPEELARVQEMMGLHDLKLEKDGRPITAEDFGAAMRDELEKKKS